ncbi:hypothetical protein J437_LFUL002742 [Ladona fulva]|uniref:Transposase n=1 Tax=Ladona fulva TaxID=123851 RepID=A0A8K0K5D3_LADFU|nr:hypothetical protein J437_LFUL002742 [Ladona fulva]
MSAVMPWKQCWNVLVIAESVQDGSRGCLQKNKKLTMQLTAKFGLTVLPHPPYSPDLAPSDFHLFGPLKDGLRGEHFQDLDAVVKAVRKSLDSAGSDFYKRGILLLFENSHILSRPTSGPNGVFCSSFVLAGLKDKFDTGKGVVYSLFAPHAANLQ